VCTLKRYGRAIGESDALDLDDKIIVIEAQRLPDGVVGRRDLRRQYPGPAEEALTGKESGYALHFRRTDEDPAGTTVGAVHQAGFLEGRRYVAHARAAGAVAFG
jgi:hypothetical protein